MTRHPLDPLNNAEIEAAVAVVREKAGLDPSAWFETVTLQEPSKPALKAWRPGDPIERRAHVCCYERSSNRTFRGSVNLATGDLENWEHVPGVQARIPPDEFSKGDEIVKKDPRFQKACAKRGITDLGKVLVESWAAGNFGAPEEQGKRIAYCHCWVMNEAGDNRYGRPIANLHPVVDLQAWEVIRIDDFGIVDLPPDTSAIRPETGLREDIKPLEITQPEGPSFTVDGYGVTWQKWHIRVGFDVREGLVLHQIGYEDKGRIRPIMHRASMAEMVVPYGDPRGGNFRRNAFDTGEYGIGAATDSLKLGCDCLGHIHYFDVSVHDWQGVPRKVSNAICMHEEDFGLLWKHTDVPTGQMRAVRSRRLVISSICTIGNYVYGFFYYFYQDGMIGVEVKATGIPFPTAISAREPSQYGTIIAPGIESHVHQHVFSYRFDMCVDGEHNSVNEVEFEAAPIGPDNPHGNAIRIIDRELASEQEAQREIDLSRARYWKVTNPSVKNKLGASTAYKLAPGANALPFLSPETGVGKRAGFMFKHFWATQYAQGEMYPAGWYPNQSTGDDGLPVWTKADRSLQEADIVVWYTLNFHHLPRPEDWPVQPVVYADFHWMPEGFFDENPALDVPPNKAL
ncbi:primary-amine oxidase [Rhodobacteraceae bacterium NNCM2]|nr:primary-amine oxidase [Coraliihabitans acroporae]